MKKIFAFFVIFISLATLISAVDTATVSVRDFMLCSGTRGNVEALPEEYRGTYLVDNDNYSKYYGSRAVNYQDICSPNITLSPYTSVTSAEIQFTGMPFYDYGYDIYQNESYNYSYYYSGYGYKHFHVYNYTISNTTSLIDIISYVNDSEGSDGEMYAWNFYTDSWDGIGNAIDIYDFSTKNSFPFSYLPFLERNISVYFDSNNVSIVNVTMYDNGTLEDHYLMAQKENYSSLDYITNPKLYVTDGQNTSYFSIGNATDFNYNTSVIDVTSFFDTYHPNGQDDYTTIEFIVGGDDQGRVKLLDLDFEYSVILPEIESEYVEGDPTSIVYPTSDDNPNPTGLVEVDNFFNIDFDDDNFIITILIIVGILMIFAYMKGGFK